MESFFNSVAARWLRRLAGWVYQYPRLFFYPQVILLVVSIFYTVENLEFSTSRNDLVGADKKYHQNFLKFRKEFGAQDDLVAVVESEGRKRTGSLWNGWGEAGTGKGHFVDVFTRAT